MTKRQKDRKTKNKKTERQKDKSTTKVSDCDVRAVLHSCDVLGYTFIVFHFSKALLD